MYSPIPTIQFRLLCCTRWTSWWRRITSFLENRMNKSMFFLFITYFSRCWRWISFSRWFMSSWIILGFFCTDRWRRGGLIGWFLFIGIRFSSYTSFRSISSFIIRTRTICWWTGWTSGFSISITIWWWRWTCTIRSTKEHDQHSIEIRLQLPDILFFRGLFRRKIRVFSTWIFRVFIWTRFLCMVTAFFGLLQYMTGDLSTGKKFIGGWWRWCMFFVSIRFFFIAILHCSRIVKEKNIGLDKYSSSDE